MSQIFKTIPSITILFNLLEQICIKDDKFYIVDRASYKLGIYNKEIENMYSILEPYYYNAKKFYITRKLDYKNFLTVIRQLCNANNIPFNYYTEFDKSTYNIIYKIFKYVTNKINLSTHLDKSTHLKV